MKFNTPIPQPLPKECEKAAKIFRSFVDNGNNGLDGVIPRSVLENAKGFAIFTIFKAGFVFSARAGSGVVIAKRPDGSWSAPSAIGTAGLGLGGQLGAEMTDFLVILNTRSAIQSFMSAGSLSLGGNMSIALGPLGRNGEAYGSVNTKGKLAAMYSYSKTRGLFGGVSIEGSVIVERQDANALAYNSPVTVRMLLDGTVDPPAWASNLISTLEKCTGLPGNRQWISDGLGAAEGQYAFGGMASPGSELPSPSRKKKRESKLSFPPTSWGTQKDSGSYFDSTETSTPTSTSRPNWEWNPDNSRPTPTRAYTDVPRDAFMKQHRFSQSMGDTFTLGRSGSLLDTSSTERSHRHSQSLANPTLSDPFSDEPLTSSTSRMNDDYNSYSRDDTVPFLRPKPELAKPLQAHEGVARAIALFDFQAVESGDLSFSKGEVIIITKKSESTDDWWTGKVSDRKGIFPANFVEVVKI